MSDTTTPWILATFTPMGYLCQRCETFERVAPPVRANDYAATGARFIAQHRTCAARRLSAPTCPETPKSESEDTDAPTAGPAQQR